MESDGEATFSLVLEARFEGRRVSRDHFADHSSAKGCTPLVNCCQLKAGLSKYQYKYLVEVLRSSDAYRGRVLTHLSSVWEALDVQMARGQRKETDGHSKCLHLNVDLSSLIDMLLDKSWSRKLTCLVLARFRMEEALAWLSTLGGAYSCLGEDNIQFARRAGEVSVSQLKIAMMSGDPGLVARCAIYQVYSLSQRGLRREARALLKYHIHPFISKMIVNKCVDNVLKNMYRAACYRVANQPFPLKEG